MSDQRALEDWVRTGLKQGSSPDTLKSQLSAYGHDPSLVDKVMQNDSTDNFQYDSQRDNTQPGRSGYQSQENNNDTYRTDQINQSSPDPLKSTVLANQNPALHSGEFEKMNFIEKSKMIIFNPEGFFNIMPKSGGYRDPLIFYSTIVLILGILSSLISIVSGGLEAGIVSLFIGFLSFIVIFIPTVFICALIYHATLKLFGAKGTYESTLRVMAYSSVPALVSWLPVPFLGFITGIYQLHIAIIGYRKVHGISTMKVVVAIILPVVLLLVIIIVLILVIGFAFFAPLLDMEVST